MSKFNVCMGAKFHQKEERRKTTKYLVFFRVFQLILCILRSNILRLNILTNNFAVLVYYSSLFSFRVLGRILCVSLVNFKDDVITKDFVFFHIFFSFVPFSSLHCIFILCTACQRREHTLKILIIICFQQQSIENVDNDNNNKSENNNKK